MLRETIELHRQGRLEEAEQGYRAALAASPDDGEALRLLGTLRRERGDLAESAQLLARAHDLAPERPNLLLMLGSVRYEAGDFEQASDAYARALVLDPNIPGAHTALGHIAMISRDNTLAEQYFRTALRVTEDAQALAGLGILALDRDDADTAMKYLTRASDLAPKDASIAFSLGRGFSKRGMLAFAEQAFRTALQLRPGLPHANNALGQLLLEAGRPDEAEPHMRALLGVRGFELPGELGLADVLRAQGKHEEAVEGYRRALTLMPSHEPGLEAMLWTLLKLGRGDEALSLLDERITAFPGQERWRGERARILASAGRYAEAAADWQVLHDRHPESAQAMIELANLRERNDEFDAATDLAEAVGKKVPDNVDAALIRVRAGMRKGDDASARALLETFAERTIDKDRARQCLNLLGRLHDRAGAAAEAVPLFKEAQSGLPGMLPRLETLPADYAEVLAQPLDEAWPQAPILLIGTPGSGVERVAALLADQPGLSVLVDRTHSIRSDGFDTRSFDHSRSELYPAAIADLREEYLAPLRARGVHLDRPLVDWIPRWDARHLIFARRLLPGTRVIVVERDPRDALLNWLAFGWLSYAGLNDFDPCVDWLGRAISHVRFGIEHGGLPHLVVNAEQVLADPAGAGAELARFVGVDTLTAGDLSARAHNILGGLPACFADGHWQAYAEVLADAFARLPAPLSPTN
jgi:tetratricopeptide (TPR) repeat protein